MESIIGHETAIQQLRAAALANEPAHAYLFTGPPQIGKRTLAIAFAQMLNCTAASRPCGVCRVCRLIAAGRHPDFRIIEAENETIKIDQIRELQREAALAAVETPWRVFLLPNVERATREAANSLLKTLEEPPSRVILVLTTLDADALLPTVLSRCRVIPLRPLPIQQVEQALRERWQVEPDQAALLARLSGGRLGWAVDALNDSTILERRQKEIALVCDMAGAGRVERLALVQQWSRDQHLAETLTFWLGWWRDLMLVKSGARDGITNIDCLEILQQQATQYPMQQITAMLQAIRQTIQYLDMNVNRQLALEVLLLNLPSPESAS